MKQKTYFNILVTVVVVCLILTIAHLIYAIYAYQHCSIIYFIAKGFGDMNKSNLRKQIFTIFLVVVLFFSFNLSLYVLLTMRLANNFSDTSQAKMDVFGISRELQLGVCKWVKPCISPTR